MSVLKCVAMLAFAITNGPAGVRLTAACAIVSAGEAFGPDQTHHSTHRAVLGLNRMFGCQYEPTARVARGSASIVSIRQLVFASESDEYTDMLLLPKPQEPQVLFVRSRVLLQPLGPSLHGTQAQPTQ